ncbi:hypothetical protein GMD78_15490 [Ornithinibacillus sp. L9]|uniref:Uncharacterized protein n=1 Tax=Ornithinibacillus caprae TaxID=2678566 RepID=A0A6N8FK65_9BACI|nr:hypothetical protein [Ornithinibacillus caprae]MUK89773.1 hypothetical protein [Ornithinibacillus caprae]
MITMIFLVIAFFMLPKIFPTEMTISILLYFAVLGLATDVLIGVDYPFNFYQIMDDSKLELFDVFIYGVNYSIYGYFFSFLIYKWMIRRGKLLLIIIYWSGQTTLIEWVSVKFHVFSYHNGWYIGYSIIAYLLVFTISAFVVKVFIHCWKSENKL